MTIAQGATIARLTAANIHDAETLAADYAAMARALRSGILPLPGKRGKHLRELATAIAEREETIRTLRTA